MKQTTFEFKVEFQSEDPFATHRCLMRAVEAVAGVLSVETDQITARCPVAKLEVSVEFEDSRQGMRLYNKLTKLIIAHEGTGLWSRTCSLTALFRDR